MFGANLLEQTYWSKHIGASFSIQDSALISCNVSNGQTSFAVLLPPTTGQHNLDAFHFI